MKTTKRFLSIVLMLAMLVSMFTVMAFADNDAAENTYTGEYCKKNGVETNLTDTGKGIHHSRDKWINKQTYNDSTCTEDGNYWYAQCADCGRWCWRNGTDDSNTEGWYTVLTKAEAAEAAKIEKHHLLQSNVVDANDIHTAYVKCTDCDTYFAVPNGNVEYADREHPKDSADAFLILPEPCAHNEIEYHEAADGYSAYGYCPDCGKYYATWDGSTYDFSNPKDSKNDFKLAPVAGDEVKVKLEIVGSGTVEVKDHGEWKTLRNGVQIETKMIDGKLSEGGILNFQATSNYRYYSIKWYYNGAKISTEDTADVTLVAGSKTLKVVFTDESSDSHTHNWVWEYNDTYHWKECSKCGTVKSNSKEKHDLYSYTKYGYTYKFCDDCGYDSYTYNYDKHPSSHDSYKYTDLNSTYHLKECKKSGCNYEVKEYHTWIKNTDRKTKDSYPYICKYCDRLSKTAYTDLPFHDVDGDVWYYDDVLYAYINGYMDGLSAGQFAPNQNTTRAQIVTILWRLTGEPRPMKSNKFNDVSSSAYYDKAVSWAVEAGVVNGFDARTFKPNDYVTREQLAAILYRYAEYMNLSTRGASNLTKYDDYYKIGTWARDAMAWANYHGLINGVSYTRIDPKGNATRAQVAAILHRFAVEFGNY